MSGSGIASAQGTVVFGLPASATADPCAPPQPAPVAFPVAQRSTLSPNASPFVPKNFALPVVATATPQAPFAVAAAAPTAADSDMYAPALPTNVQTIYVTGLPGYYAPYVPTPTVPFYTMQYQCVYQAPPPPPPHHPPMGGVCCPMEEGNLPPPLVADEAPPTAAMLPPGAAGAHHHHLQASGHGNALLPHPPHHHQQQQPTLIIQNSGRRNKKKSRSGRRRDHASHRDGAATVGSEACIVNAEYTRSGAAPVARHSSHSGGAGTVATAPSRSAYEPGAASSSPDFSSRSEFPSLPVQEFPPRQSPSSGGCISYSSALQQQRAPLMPSSTGGGRERGEEPHNARGTQGRRGGGVGNADGRPHKRGGGGGARKHRRGGGEGRRAEEAADAAARSQPHYPQPQQSPAPAPQQERRGGARRGRPQPLAAAQAVAMDGEAEKHQFEAPEKDVKGELRLPRPPAEMESTARANSAGGRSSNQGGGGVRVNASRGRRETRHSSLLRGVLKGGAERQGLRSGGGRKGSDSAATERHPTPSDQQQPQRPGENRTSTQEDKPTPRKNSRSFVGENESSDEYPPLGSSGGAQDRSLERTTKSDGKQDSVKIQGDIPKQQQSQPRDKSGKQGVAPPAAKPLVSTNSSGGGPKHKAAISMAIVDIMVPKQRQPKKLKEKENLLERSSKKPEVGGWDP